MIDLDDIYEQNQGYCGEPKTPKHTRIIHGSLYTYPHTVEFGCEDGYHLQGQKVIRCQIDGLWSSFPPRCVSSNESFPWWAVVVIVVITLPLVSYTIIKCYHRLRHISEEDHSQPEYEAIPVTSLAYEDYSSIKCNQQRKHSSLILTEDDKAKTVLHHSYTNPAASHTTQI